MVSVDRYLGKTYDRRTYNCVDFARDVWRDATGEDLGDIYPPTPHARGKLKRIAAPQDPCLVLMRSTEAHLGVYLRGRVLHLTQAGAEFTEIPVATRGCGKVRFYR